MADFVSYDTSRDGDQYRRRLCAPATVAIVESVIAADEFNAAAVDALATRSIYADAAWLLVSTLRPHFRQAETIIPTLVGTTDTRVLAYRFAVLFGVLPAASHVLMSLDSLRAIDTPDARRALAAAGFIEWSSAAREALAAFALRRLVFAFRDRSS